MDKATPQTNQNILSSTKEQLKTNKEVGPVRSMEGINPNSCTRQVEKKARPLEQLNCPRCNSTNTKFCYYNNYSLTQPRYYCKTCRRYWTEGGSLRNVPVGGGSRKNKKVITSSSSPSSKVPDLNPISSQNPKIMQGGHDLNLAFPSMENYHHNISSYVEMPKLEVGNTIYHGMASRGLNNSYVHNSLMPNSSTLYSSSFPMQEIKPNLGFSIIDHGLGNRSYNNTVQENGVGRVSFPFGNMKQLSNSGVEVEHNKEQGNSSTGYWTKMVGEGSSW